MRLLAAQGGPPAPTTRCSHSAALHQSLELLAEGVGIHAVHADRLLDTKLCERDTQRSGGDRSVGNVGGAMAQEEYVKKGTAVACAPYVAVSLAPTPLLSRSRMGSLAFAALTAV